MTTSTNNALRLIALTWIVALSFAATAQDPKPSPPTAHPNPAPGIPTTWKQVPIPALHEFKPQEPRRVELPNGMILFLQEDHELPLINGVIRVRGGGRDEPAEKAGMSEIYGEVWRTGGTKSKTGDQTCALPISAEQNPRPVISSMTFSSPAPPRSRLRMAKIPPR